MDDPAITFVRLWTRSQHEVRRYVYMLLPRAADADDVLQETATRLWEKFSEYDPQRPFVPWAIRFAYLEVLKWRQRQSRDKLCFSDDLMASLDVTLDEEAPLLEVRRRVLDGCLRKLSDRDRELLLERYARHGAVQSQAARTQVSTHKLYYLIEKIRTRLLTCIDTTLRTEGWQHG